MSKKNIKDAMDKIKVTFGKESVMLLGQKPRLDVDVISTGSLLINKALGIKGYPKGRIVEIYGPESSGKTTLALHAVAEVQKNGGVCAFVDAEHAIDPTYARALGVNVEELILSQPDSGEQALEIVDILTKTGAIDLIIVDSVAALVPEAELNGEMKDQTMGAQARLMSKALRKITGSLSKRGTTIIFINQIREKIGIVFGNPETTPGGRALKFYSSIRMEIRRVSSLGTGEKIIGNNVRIKVLKNKLAPPFKVTNTEIYFGKGISIESEIIQLAEEAKIFIRKGAWYKYEDKNIAQGKTNLKILLEKDKAFKKEILNKIENSQNNELFNNEKHEEQEQALKKPKKTTKDKVSIKVKTKKDKQKPVLNSKQVAKEGNSEKVNTKIEKQVSIQTLGTKTKQVVEQKINTKQING